MKDYEIKGTWNLYNRPSFEIPNGGKGKYSSNVLKKKPEIDYIS